MDKRAKSKLIVLLSALLVISAIAYFVSAAHVITTSTGTTIFNVNEDITNLYNITVNNSDILETANITQVNITLPASFTFLTDSNGTDAAISTFVNTSSVLSWTNADALVMNLTLNNFWFNATASTPGNYNITVTTVNVTGAYSSNISVVVNDTTAPGTIIFVSPTSANNTYFPNSAIAINISATDNGIIERVVIRLYNSTSDLVNSSTSGSLGGSSNAYFVNFTGHADGVYFVNATANDTYNNANSTGIRTFVIDTTKPLISFGTGNQDSGANVSVDWVYMNVSASDLNENTITFKLYNTTSNYNTTSYTGGTTRTINITGVPDGVYTYNVTVNDSAGNVNVTETRTITVDTTNPLISFGTITEASGVNRSQSWIYANVSITETNIANVTFSLSNVTGIVNSTTFAVDTRTINWTGLTTNGVYYYNVTVTDYTNHVNSTITNIITLDTTSPNATLVTPANNSYVNNVTQNYTVNISDNIGVANATLNIVNSTGAVVNQTTTSFGGGVVNSVIGTVVTLVDGVYTWFWNLFDFAGNQFTTTVNNTITIDTVTPSAIQFVNPTPVTGTNLSQTTLAANVTATDVVSLGTIVIRLFNSSNDQINFSSTSSSPNYINFANLVDGVYYLNATVNDTAGNANYTETRTIRLDATKPLIDFAANTDATGINVSRLNVFMNVTLSDAGSGVQNVTFSVFNSTGIVNESTTAGPGVSAAFNATLPRDGVYTYNVTATDYANNINTTSTRTMTLDTIAPNGTIVAPVNGSYINATNANVNFTINVTDFSGSGVANATLNIYNSTSLYNSTTITGPVTGVIGVVVTLVDGVYTWFWNLFDFAGNQFNTQTAVGNYTVTEDTILPVPIFDGLTETSGTNVSRSNIVINVTVAATNLANITINLYNSTGPYNSTTTSTSPNFVNISGLADGIYYFNATAIDLANNRNSTETRTVRVDTINPQLYTAVITNPDNFFSTVDKIVNISVNVSDAGTMAVTANFSNISATLNCGNGANAILNLTFGANNLYNGGCDISSADLSAATNPDVRTIGILAVDGLIGHQNNTQLIALLHNMDVPAQMPPGPQRFGNLTTNFTQVLNFSAVNFIIQIEFNGSTLTGPGGGTSPWEGYQQILMLNFTSLNMTSQTIGQRLAGLQTALQVNITAPNQFGVTRIYVNETAFAELNTNTTITLNNLPFASLPIIASDNSSRNASNVVFTPQTPFQYSVDNPVPLNITVPRGYLTFTVVGFSGYNATDTANPTIAINTPIVNLTNGTSVLVNVTVNGTGTKPSLITIDGLNGTTFVYNGSIGSTVNNAQCRNMSADQETFNCLFPINLAEGSKTLVVNAWDFGGLAAPGNTNSTNVTFTVDSAAPFMSADPATSVASGSAYNSSLQYQFNVTLNDSGVGIQTVLFEFNGTNYTAGTAGGGVYNYTFSTLAAGSYAYRFLANDTFGNMNNSLTSGTYAVNQSTPTLTLTNYSALTLTYETASNFTGSGCNSQITCLLYRNNASTGGSSEQLTLAGNTTYTYVYNTTGNQNYTNATTSALVLIVNRATGVVYAWINNTRANAAIPNGTLNYLLNGTLPTGSGSIILIKNGTTINSGTSPISNLTNFTSPGDYNITASYAGNENYTAASERWTLTVMNPSGVVVNQTAITVNSSQTELVVTNITLLQNVTIPASVPQNQTILIDLGQALTSDGNVTIGTTNVIAARTDNSTGINYTIVIPANTNISGGSGWDGNIILPTVNTSTFTAPSSGTVDVVIEMGSNVELNFSNPVKITITGKAGKKAAWSRGSATLNNIATVCDSTTAPTNINPTTTRECYIDSGSDLVIWTYHFTEFATYTAAVATTSTTSSGGGNLAPAEGWKNTYVEDDKEFSEKQTITKSMEEKEAVRIMIDRALHYVGIISLTSTTATIQVESTPQQATLNIGDSKEFDVTNDSYYDIKVTLNSISSGKAGLTVSYVHDKVESVQAAAPVAEKPSIPSIPEVIKAIGSNKTNLIWIGLVILVVVIAAIVLMRRKSGHTRK